GGDPAQPEVDQGRLSLFADHDVAGGQVAVDHHPFGGGTPSRVQNLQNHGDLFQVAQHLTSATHTLHGVLGPPVAQVHAFHVVHHQVQGSVGVLLGPACGVLRGTLEVLTYPDHAKTVDEAQQFGLLAPAEIGRAHV